MKKFLGLLLILSPLLAFSQEVISESPAPLDPDKKVPLANCNAKTISTCEYFPVYREVPMEETKVTEQEWGTIFLTSTPTEVDEYVKNVKIVIKVKCTGQPKKVVYNATVCGYQKFSTTVDPVAEAFYVDYDPILNFSQDGKTFTLTVKVPSSKKDGTCVDKTVTEPTGCSNGPTPENVKKR